MVKKVILFIRTSKYIITLLLTSIFLSCNNSSDKIYVESVSGNIIVEGGLTNTALIKNDILSKKMEAKTINFKSGFAILQLDSIKLILPKDGKQHYSFNEIIEEFKFCKKNINQKYLYYISENIRKKHGESEGKTEAKGVVSRGQNFLYSIKPHSNCNVWKDSINFTWNTNLVNDTLKIHILNNKQQPVGEIISLPRKLNKKVLKQNIGITVGGTYYWQITRKTDEINYNAWKRFEVLGANEINKAKESIADELNLSQKTKDDIMHAIVCGL